MFECDTPKEAMWLFKRQVPDLATYKANYIDIALIDNFGKNRSDEVFNVKN
jgi:hypothetical protein